MNVVCDSRISQVTVHARGALVTRRVAVPTDLPDGNLSLEIPDVTVLAEGGSVRAALVGSGREVVGVRTALHVPEARALPGASVERVRTLTGRVDRMRAEQRAIATHRGRLLELQLEPRLRRAARGATDAAGVAARAADAMATTAMVGEALERLDLRLLEIDEAIRDLDEALEAARLADAQAQSRARIGAGHPSRRITIELSGAGPVEAAELTYVVPAARWWPTYTLRLTEAGRRASWSLEALVAQRSGESWEGVRLSLSTADLVHDARLPELAARRLGRAQPAPPRPAYRPPPAGLDRMFAGYDVAFTGLPPAQRQTGEMAAVPAPDEDDSFVADEEPTRPDARITFGVATGAVPAPQSVLDALPLHRPSPTPPRRAMMAAPAPMPMSAPGGVMVGGATPPMQQALAKARAGGAGGADRAATVPPREPAGELEPADEWLDFDGLHMAGPSDPRRGRLVATGPGAAAARAQEARQVIEGLAPAPGALDPMTSRGRFDHRYDGEGAADVPSDGLPHRVTLMVAEATPELHWRTVPREVAEVYREASLANPFAAPLLAGPVDVYLEGSLLATTAVAHIDRGGRLTVGMGVEDRIKIARNARHDESPAGLMRGSTLVETTVTIELASSLGAPASVEVIDRVPITDDKALEIELLPDGRPPEKYDQAERGSPVRGGLRWVAEVPAGGKTKLSYRYTMTFSSKSELVGGNRRD